MGVLKSDLFVNATANARADTKVTVRKVPAWTEMDVNKRLEGCATSDPQHITPGANQIGPHVAVLHQALEKLAASAFVPAPPNGTGGSAGADLRAHNDAVKALRAVIISSTERQNAQYGDTTARMVKAYKVARDIKRPGAAVDNIVGIMTIQAIDRDLTIAAGGGVPDAPDTRRICDFVIRCVGGRPTSENSPSLAKSRLNLAGFTGVQPGADPADMLSTELSRQIHFIGRGSQNPDISPNLGTEIADEVDRVLNNQNVRLGIICVTGSSAGGRNAMFAAASLAQSGKAVEYVGLEDAAFFAPDSTVKPQASEFVPLPIGKPRNIPQFSPPGGFAAKTKINFFQSIGNQYRFSARNGLDWTGVEKNLEIHGNVTGFTNTPINPPEISDNTALAHGNCVGKATPKNDINITALIRRK